MRVTGIFQLDRLRMGVICKTWSFPRRWESTPHAFGNAAPTEWIPVFAGMTGGSPFYRNDGPNPASVDEREKPRTYKTGPRYACSRIVGVDSRF